MADGVIDKILDRVSSIKLSGGLVGRVCHVLIVVTVALGAIGAMSGNLWVMLAAVAGILVIAFPILWRIINFARDNPQAAILDGAEFIRHEEIKLGHKGNPVLLVDEAGPKTVAHDVDPLAIASQLPEDALIIAAPKDDQGGKQ